MKIQKFKIKNFRKLKDIEISLKGSINTIVGPNGVGKSTILDGLRIIKSLIFPSFESEGIQTLQHMGLLIPPNSNILLAGIIGEESNPCEMTLEVSISDVELEKIKNNINQFAAMQLQNRLGRLGQSNLNLLGYLSSPEGKEKLEELKISSRKALERYNSNKILSIKVRFGYDEEINVEGGFEQEVLSYLMRTAPYSKTLFSIFPPDRHFPTGDTNVQLGQADVSLQVQSYSINPHLKFQRFKTALISEMMLSENGYETIKQEFTNVFNALLPGKTLDGIKLEQRTGRLSILIKEEGSNKVYDIDFLSSGEKGILLTAFLLRRTLEEGGIALLDEPELHLNPAVCRNIIPFLKNEIALKNNIQIIMTSHSGEILTSTKEDPDLQLFHLIDSSTVTKILYRDQSEAQQALRLLGVEASDLLFNKGIIYFEGNTDEEYIPELFRGKIDGFKIRSLGGRTILESEIIRLQGADLEGNLDGYHIFILDNDNKPTSLKSTKNVKVVQWDRYSIENYLLNLDILYDVVKKYCKENIPTVRSDFNKEVKEIALAQLDKVVLLDNYSEFLPDPISVSKKILKDKNVEEIAVELSVRLQEKLSEFQKLNFKQWESDFKSGILEKLKNAKSEWEIDWIKRCKGKDLLISIYDKFSIKRDLKTFIIEIIREMRDQGSEELTILHSKLSEVLPR